MKAYKIGKIKVYAGEHLAKDCESVLVMLKQGHKWVLGYNKFRGGWELPGGHIEARETIIDTAVREAKEEANATIKNLALFGYYELPNGHRTAVISAEVDSFLNGALENEISKVQLYDDFPEDVTFKDGLYSFLAELISTADVDESSNYTVSNKTVWDAVWENVSVDRYSDPEIRRQVSSGKIKTLEKLGVVFQEEEAILESGCGDATMVLSLADRFNAHAYGVDFSDVAIKKAKKNAQFFGRHINLKHADVRNTPYPDGKFDKILSLGIIEHFKSPEVSVSELFRLTKSGGTLILMTPNKRSFGPIDRNVQQMLGRWPFGYQTEYTPRQLKLIAEDAGFVTDKSVATQRPWIKHDKANMKLVSILDQGASFLFDDCGFYSWYIGRKP